jgi:recombinational DNA repair ATPase RecF
LHLESLRTNQAESEDRKIDLATVSNVLVGGNAQGKTNFPRRATGTGARTGFA